MTSLSRWIWSSRARCGPGEGPRQDHFVTVPDDESVEIEAASALVTYGWGMVPVEVRIGETRWTTALWPKDGGYIVPLKDAVRNAEELDVDDVVEVRLRIDG